MCLTKWRSQDPASDVGANVRRWCNLMRTSKTNTIPWNACVRSSTVEIARICCSQVCFDFNTMWYIKPFNAQLCVQSAVFVHSQGRLALFVTFEVQTGSKSVIIGQNRSKSVKIDIFFTKIGQNRSKLVKIDFFDQNWSKSVKIGQNRLFDQNWSKSVKIGQNRLF